MWASTLCPLSSSTAEEGVRQCLDHRAFDLDGAVFLGHVLRTSSNARVSRRALRRWPASPGPSAGASLLRVPPGVGRQLRSRWLLNPAVAAVLGGQHPRAVRGDRDRVLEVRGPAAVGGDDRPAVLEQDRLLGRPGSPSARSPAPSRPQPRPAARAAVVGHRRAPCASRCRCRARCTPRPGRSSRRPRRSLHRVRDVAEPPAGLRLREPATARSRRRRSSRVLGGSISPTPTVTPRPRATRRGSRRSRWR
jgi:hypothetical protein